MKRIIRLITFLFSVAAASVLFITVSMAGESFSANVCDEHIPFYADDMPATILSFGRTGGCYCSVCWQELEAPTFSPMLEPGTMYKGMYGDDVQQLQMRLKELGFLQFETEGYYDDLTFAAVALFQAENGMLPITGILDDPTLFFLRWMPFDFENITYGMVSPAVMFMQDRLIAMGYLDGDADGYFGDYTLKALSMYQRINGLDETGIADLTTMEMLALGWGKWINTLSPGSQGEDVANIQQLLQNDGYYWLDIDGSYGYFMDIAIRLFQSYNGIENPGTDIDVSTYYLLESPHVTFYELSEGDTGTPVLMAQKYLHELGYLEREADGIYGDETMAAMTAFQENNDLVVTGTGYYWTMMLLFSGTANAAAYPDNNELLPAEDGALPAGNVTLPTEDISGYLKELFSMLTSDNMTPAEKLWSVFRYVGSREDHPYAQNRIPYYLGYDWPLVYARDMIYLGASDCHGFASLFGYLAILCGYSDDIYWCMAPDGSHAWVEIDGLVYDPVLMGSSSIHTVVFGWTYVQSYSMNFGYGYADPYLDPATIIKVRVPSY